ncbi:organic solvents resistance ABC transporter permease [Bifidobacterium italicum]|uniref:Organic solvents resistance ABC transporter permease n=1 Tax=Bifidobacterium italicum TaxID=1960968 RepID=A0A2A2EIF8_9BIFI|nr:DUF5719 family protein [Bifidobacterium italicum]PAU68767.1 organic solvents resistance ABC transporter permease [Bifidobacterium italicum]
MSEEPNRLDDFAHRTRAVATTAVTGVAVVALFAALTVVPPRSGVHDAAAVDSATVSEQASARQTLRYCPAAMTIADTASYGDEEFRTSTGDLASARRYAAFGSVFHAQADALGADDSADGLVLEGAHGGEGSDVFIAGQDKADGATILDTRLLSAADGTGSTGAVASWATTGDIPGIAAASCVTPALVQRFLVPSTTTGNTQQLVVVNPSDKPTSIDIAMWGTKHGRITPATSSVLTVGANGRADMLLNAAAPDEQGLYVTVTSHDAPVGAVVRSVAIDGLTPHGNDYVTPLDAAATTQTIMLPDGDASTTLSAYADKDAAITLSWMSDHGLVDIGRLDAHAGKVTLKELKDRPKDAHAILAQSDAPCALAAQSTIEGADGRHDYAVIGAHAAYAQSALALPTGASATIALANTGERATTITLTGYDSDGAPSGTKRVKVDADSSASLDADDLGDGVEAIRVDTDDVTIVWGAFPTNATLREAKTAALAYVPATSLDVPRQLVHAFNDPGIVR